MVRFCSSCKCNSQNKRKGVTFHKFPSQPDRRKLWRDAVYKADPTKVKDWQPGNYSCVCSDHFETQEIRYDRGSTILRPTAVPSKFTFPNSLSFVESTPSESYQNHLFERSLQSTKLSENHTSCISLKRQSTATVKMKMEGDAEFYIAVRDSLLDLCLNYYKDKCIREIEGAISLVFDTDEKTTIVIKENLVGKFAMKTEAVDFHEQNTDHSTTMYNEPTEMMGSFLNRMDDDDANRSDKKPDLRTQNGDDDSLSEKEADIVYYCPYCEKQFDTKFGLKRHAISKHGHTGVRDSSLFAVRGIKLNKLSCHLCTKSFVNNVKLKYHRKRFHGKLRKYAVTRRKTSADPKEMANMMTFPEDDLPTGSTGQSESHVETDAESRNRFANGTGSKTCPEEEVGDDDDSESEKEDDIVYRCPYCYKPFHAKYGLKRHVVTKHDRAGVRDSSLFTVKEVRWNKPRCQWCRRTFTTNQKLMYHRHRLHRDVSSCNVTNETIYKRRDDGSKTAGKLKVLPLRQKRQRNEISRKDTSDEQQVHQRADKEFNENSNFSEPVERNIKDAPGFSLSLETSLVEPNDLQYCGYCDKHFWTKWGLKRHLQAKHGKKNLAHLSDTDVNIGSVNEDKLDRNDNSQEFKTDYHDEEMIYCCPECQNNFSDKRSFFDHLNVVHRYNFKSEGVKESVNDKASNSVRKLYECNHCDGKYTTRNTLRRHLLMFHKRRRRSSYGTSLKLRKGDDIDQGDPNTYDKVERDLKMTKTSFECKCSVQFNKRKDLYNHRNNVHKKKRCPLCQIDFSGFFGLREHSKALHSGVSMKKKRFVCEFCAASFNTGMRLTDHIESKHLGVLFPCDVCDKVLGSAETRQIHRRMHDSEKHKTCDVCGERFSRFQGFIEHLRRFHPDNVPEKYGSTFACVQCGITFTRKQGLKKHTDLKHGDAVFTCVSCGKAFPARHYLRRHERDHHNIYHRPHQKFNSMISEGNILK